MQTVPGSISLPVTLILVINTLLTPVSKQWNPRGISEIVPMYQPSITPKWLYNRKHARFNSIWLFCFTCTLLFFILSQPAMSLWFCDLQTLTQFTTLPILGYKCCGCKTTSLHFKSAQLTAKGIWASLYIIHSRFYSWNRKWVGRYKTIHLCLLLIFGVPD